MRSKEWSGTIAFCSGESMAAANSDFQSQRWTIFPLQECTEPVMAYLWDGSLIANLKDANSEVVTIRD